MLAAGDHELIYGPPHYGWNPQLIPARSYFGERVQQACAAFSGRISVMTSGHAWQALSPDCKCQRHCGRILHSGSTKELTGPAKELSCSLNTRSMMLHLLSAHWTQAARLHVLLKRNRFSGERPWRAVSTKDASIMMRSFENATEPSAKTIPMTLAPASHPQLGQRIAVSDMFTPEFPHSTAPYRQPVSA